MASTTRVALVTGAARGIGRAIALRLAEDGFDVAVNDLPDTPELEEVLRGIQNKGRRSIAVPADVSLEPEVVGMIQDVVQKLGNLDVVSSLPERAAAKRAESVTQIDGCERGHDPVSTPAGQYVTGVFFHPAERRSDEGYILLATVEEFDRLLAVNLRSVMLCYKHAAKQMIAQGRGGRIIGAAKFSFVLLPIHHTDSKGKCQ